MPGGFGGPGGGFSHNRNSGKAATATTIKRPPLGPPKPPGKLVRVENLTRAMSGGALIKYRDYSCLACPRKKWLKVPGQNLEPDPR